MELRELNLPGSGAFIRVVHWTPFWISVSALFRKNLTTRKLFNTVFFTLDIDASISLTAVSLASIVKPVYFIRYSNEQIKESICRL